MSNLPGKITDPHLPRKNRSPSAVVSASFCKPCCWPSAAQPSSELSEFYLFSFSKSPCRIRAILCAAFVLTCILTAEGKPSSPKDDTSAEK